MDDIDPASLPPDRALGLLVTRLDAVRRDAEQRARLGAADMRLMWLLTDDRPRTLREIAEVLRLEQSTVNRQVNAALREGLVERYREAGRPASLFRPTPHGRELFEGELEYFLALYREGLTALGEREGEFLELLHTFVGGYSRAVRREG